MKNSLLFTFILLFALSACQPEKQANQVTINIDPSEITGNINEMIYGHFFEHIYHSANGGLWGDMIWNRSFEEFPVGGNWYIEEDILHQSRLGTDIKIIFGDKGWKDYEINLEAKRTGGNEAFLILMRAVDEENFYWYNIGGWGNTRHVLEKELDDNRKPVSEDFDGNIEDDRWYKIRIKCEGNNIQAWIDDKLTLDYTDDTDPHLKGGIGLGSWSTIVEYKNIEVKGLDGKVLFKGLPELPKKPLLPRHWEQFGESVAGPVKTDPLNSEYCLKFTSSDKPSGVYQDDIAVEADIHYNGSIWIRGNKSDSLIVRLETENEKLAENILTGFTKEWKEYPVHFLPEKTTDEAAIALIANTDRHFFVDQFSLMSENSENNGGFRPDLYEAVDALKPPIIRWPGGCFAELYRWKDGIGKQHERGVFPINIWDDKDVNSLGTDEFIELCRKLNSEPLIVINSGFHEGAGTQEEWEPWVKEACEWLEYCNGPANSEWGKVRAKNGHPEPYNVKYWEIDNELWRSRVPDAKIYSEAVKIFAEALKKVDPSIIILAHGGNGTDEDWNKILVENSADYFDILSVHHYMDPDLFNEGVNMQEEFYLRTAETMATSSNPDMKLYVSEWNAQSTDWRTGLYAGGLLNAFERCGDFLTIGGPALFLRHTSAKSWDNAFINFDQRGWFPAPNYVVMKLWRENYAPQRIQSKCDDPDINHIVTLSKDRKTLFCKLVNPMESSKKIRIIIDEKYQLKEAGFELISGESLGNRNTMEHPDKIKPEKGKIINKGKNLMFEIPAFSCGIVKVNLKN